MLVAAIVAVSSCSTDDGADAPPPTTVLSRPTAAPSTAAGIDADQADLLDGIDTLPGELPATIAPEPTGVPGVASDAPFCSAFARLVGTQQVLAVAISFGVLDPVAAARLETMAAPAVLEAVGTIGRLLPAELEAEREALTEQRLGPFVRRAETAVQALRRAGADDESLVALSALWGEVLATRDNTTHEITVPNLDEETERWLDAAAADFAARLVPLVDDPSLVSEGVSTPLTDAVVAAECPELFPSLVGDEI
jgi:hypothetical protein